MADLIRYTSQECGLRQFSFIPLEFDGGNMQVLKQLIAMEGMDLKLVLTLILILLTMVILGLRQFAKAQGKKEPDESCTLWNKLTKYYQTV